MLKASAQARQGAPAPRHRGTKGRIVEAALETLKAEGFAGASARAIARTGGFNQALIFYHFGTVVDLLLAALDETSARRMERYRESLEGVEAPEELLRLARELYVEDLEAGHMKVLAEMIVAASSVPSLGPEIVARIEPWIRFAEDALARGIPDPLEELVSRRDLAFATVAFYLGLEMLTHLEGDPARADALFELAGRLAPLAQPLLQVLASSRGP